MEKINKIKAEFVRHGKPTYSEEEYKSGKFEGTLTENGKKELEETINKLAENISDDELVVILSSPKKRAIESAEIAHKILKEKGVNIFPSLKITDSLKDIQMTPEFVESLKDFEGFWMEYWAKKNLPEGVEKPEDVKKRAQRVIAYLNRVGKIKNLTQKIRFVLFGHEEGVRDLLMEAFGIDTEKGEGPTYAENISVNFFNVGENATKLEVSYRDKKGVLDFDSKTRDFKKRSE